MAIPMGLWRQHLLKKIQRPLVEAVLADRDACAVLSTGGGKTLVYKVHH